MSLILFGNPTHRAQVLKALASSRVDPIQTQSGGMGDLQSSDFQRYQVTLAALGKINPTTKILAIRFKRQGMAFHMRLVTCEDHTQTKAFGEQPPAARAATLASALTCGKGMIAGKVHKGVSVPRAAILTSMRRSGPFFAPAPAQATVTRADPPTSPQARRSSSTMTQASPQHVAFAAEEPDAAELTSAPRAHRSPAKGFTTENPAALTSAPHQASQVHTPSRALIPQSQAYIPGAGLQYQVQPEKVVASCSSLRVTGQPQR